MLKKKVYTVTKGNIQGKEDICLCVKLIIRSNVKELYQFSGVQNQIIQRSNQVSCSS